MLLVLNLHSQTWTANAKDVIWGLDPNPSSSKNTWRGTARPEPLSALHLPLRAVSPFKRLLLALLFRRVSPAEGKSYALVRNTFALFSLAIIIWRAVSVFSGAQNGFETHIVSRECPLPRRNFTDIQVIIGGSESSGALADLGVTVTETTDLDDSEDSLLGKSLIATLIGIRYGVPGSFSSLLVTILIAFAGALLEPLRMPYIWLSNLTDASHDDFEKYEPSDSILESAVPWFAPYWQLRPGFHIEAKAGHMVRKLMKPAYNEFSIYPISTNTAEATGNKTIATASILLSFQQNMPFFKGRDKAQISQHSPNTQICDYIEDQSALKNDSAIGMIAIDAATPDEYSLELLMRSWVGCTPAFLGAAKLSEVPGPGAMANFTSVGQLTDALAHVTVIPQPACISPG
ncbi:hypothetical protein BDV93DRAFT_516349 [Ceratobasidium sp. AG-I]|nr:hypothetical protein BDV93DRAFT_516349 [Ceratobasidium sp. AG-I]